jgi:hypothetical protein
MEALPHPRRSQGGQAGQGVQHELPVAEIHTLREPRRPCRVERRGACVLVEVTELVAGGARREQLLVLGGDRERGCRPIGTVGEKDVRLHGLDPVLDLLEHRQKIGVDQEDGGAGVVERIEDLLGGEPDVHRLEHRPHHGHGEVALEVPVAVPVHHGHGVPRLDAQQRERTGELADPLVQRPVVVALQVAVDDLLVRRRGQRGMEQVFDEQRIGVGRGRALDEVRDQAGVEIRRHGVFSFFLSHRPFILLSP